MLLHFPFKTVVDPFINTDQRRTLWDWHFQGANASFAHGDLNPRNILLIRGSGEDFFSPVLIDFHRFGVGGPLAIDFARLECGIQIKGLKSYISQASSNVSQHENLVRYEKCINSHNSFEDNYQNSPEAMSLPPELRKAVAFVCAIRNSYKRRVPYDFQDSHSYFSVLMFNYLSYLRGIYDNILTTEQKLFAFYSAACIFKRHFLYPVK